MYVLCHTVQARTMPTLVLKLQSHTVTTVSAVTHIKHGGTHRHAGACNLPLLLVLSVPGVVGRRRVVKLARLESQKDTGLPDAHVPH